MDNTIIIKGKVVDDETRCIHYHSELDVIAIKFKCCNTYYPCFYCHVEVTNHQTEVWMKEEFDTNAILCGVCKTELSIKGYKNCNYQCPNCNAAFNPKCVNHDYLYFEH